MKQSVHDAESFDGPLPGEMTTIAYARTRES